MVSKQFKLENCKTFDMTKFLGIEVEVLLPNLEEIASDDDGVSPLLTLQRASLEVGGTPLYEKWERVCFRVVDSSSWNIYDNPSWICSKKSWHKLRLELIYFRPCLQWSW